MAILAIMAIMAMMAISAIIFKNVGANKLLKGTPSSTGDDAQGVMHRG